MRGSLYMKKMNSRRALTSAIFAALALFFLVPGLSFAQIDTGSIVGQVSDPSGAGIPGATLTLKNEATSVSRTVNTNNDGEYQFAAITPGIYSVQAEPPISRRRSVRTSKSMCRAARPSISP